MKTIISALTVALLAAVLSIPAFAEEWPPDLQIMQMGGDRLVTSKTATTASVNFQYWTKFVKVCAVPTDISQTEPVTAYIRLATGLAGSGGTVAQLALATGDTTKMTVFATNAATFIDSLTVNSAGAVATTGCTGKSNCTRIHGSAMPIQPAFVRTATIGTTVNSVSDTESWITKCSIEPWNTLGITVFATSNAIFDVWGYR